MEDNKENTPVKNIEDNSPVDMLEAIYGYVEKSLIDTFKGEDSTPLKTIEYGGSIFIALKNGSRYRLNLSKYSQEVVLDSKPEPTETSVPLSKDLTEKVFQSIGHASMCWIETPKGIFDDKEASVVAESLIKDININMFGFSKWISSRSNFYYSEILDLLEETIGDEVVDTKTDSELYNQYLNEKE